MDKNGPGPSKVFGSDFYDLADPLLDQNFPRSYGYDVTFTNFQEGEKFIEDVIGIKLIAYDEKEKNNYQFIIVEIDEDVTHISRDQIAKILHAENIIARPYFFPSCHRVEPYRSYFPHAGLLLPETEKLAKRVLTLPTGTSVGNDEIKIICQIIRLVIENGEELKVRLQSTNGR